MPENISGVPAGRSVFHLTSPFIGLLGNFAPRRPQSASAFQLPLCSPCCTSLLARLEFPVQEILRPQSGHVPENIYHRGVVLRGIRVESATKYRTIGSAVLMFALAAILAIVSAVAQEKNPDRNACFGETHLHTCWPVDAWMFGNRFTGPDDAYKFSSV